MNIIKEPNLLNGASEMQFLENTMINLLAANEFGKLIIYNAEKTDDKAPESELLGNLLNDAQQNELY